MPPGLKLDGGMLSRVPAGADSDTMASVLNDMIDRLNSILKTQIFSDGQNQTLKLGLLPDGSIGILVSDPDNARVFMGRDKNGSFFTKLSQTGKDVLTATDDELIFSSLRNSFKIVKSDTAIVTVTAADAFARKKATIAHGLSTTPLVLATVEGYYGLWGGPAGRAICPVTMYEEYIPSSGPAGRLEAIGYIDASADATNIYLNVNVGDVAFFTQLQRIYNFRYYILQETGGVT